MKATNKRRKHEAGYALMTAMLAAGVILLTLAYTVSRTQTNSKLNNRGNQFLIAQNAAEAAVEKAVAAIKYDFSYGNSGLVAQNLDSYTTNFPNKADDPYWTNFTFSDAQGHDNKIYVKFLSNYVGDLPSRFHGLYLASDTNPVYRVVANAKVLNTDGSDCIGAAQEDVLLALVPINQYAIFYNGLLEFSSAAEMNIYGRTHANSNIYTGSSAKVSFYGTVTTTGTITSPANNGSTRWSYTNFMYAKPPSRIHTPNVSLAIGTNNVHSLIEFPTNNEVPSKARMYYQAQAIMVITNISANTVATLTLRTKASTNSLPYLDLNPVSVSATNNNISSVFPFLKTNSFYDMRESKTVISSDIDIDKYSTWMQTNTNAYNKFVASGDGVYPSILFVADVRNTNSTQMQAIRLTNGMELPINGTYTKPLGFSVATPNPLYVIGHYNCTNSSYLNTTNTSATVPAALMCDALTILSPQWKDANSKSSSRPSASATTVNAAILTGVVPSTGTTSTTFSGGVHNLPRLLENWGNGSTVLTLNTAIICLYNSKVATSKFQNPSYYYTAPKRNFGYDAQFAYADRQPPGIPSALFPLRISLCYPPPNTVTYNPE